MSSTTKALQKQTFKTILFV